MTRFHKPCKVDFEGRVSALVFGDELAIDPDAGLPIDGTKYEPRMQAPPTARPFPRRGHLDGPLVPTHAQVLGVAHAGEWTFPRERHDDRVAERVLDAVVACAHGRVRRAIPPLVFAPIVGVERKAPRAVE